jgi:hypothetical protein
MAFSATWYFAFVEESETAFDPDVHNRVDLDFLGFAFDHAEGNFATLRITTRNPLGEGGTFALGLLGPGRKQWCWFSWDPGTGIVPLFFGRLVGIPTDVFGRTVTLDFQARPKDYKDQKQALAETLKVRPYWAPEFYEETQRDDPDTILEAYSAVWYVDPVTHEVSISDVLLGESGTEVFQKADHRFDGMQMSLADPGTSSVEVTAEFNWTQRAVGSIDMELSSVSHTLSADNYPKAGASFGDGWTVTTANVTEPSDYKTRTVNQESGITIKWWDGNVTSVHTSSSEEIVVGPGERWPGIITKKENKSAYDDDGNLTSWSVNEAWSEGLTPLHEVSASYSVGYDAGRPFKEKIAYTLTADVQPTLVQPEDVEPERLDFKTVDMSNPEEGVAIIGDPRRRSFVSQADGNQSLAYTLLVARANLRKRSRNVEITFAPFLDRLGDLRLDRNATVQDWRLPGGTATGKITRFSCALTPPTSSGAAQLSLTVTMGCAPGRGGTIAGADGDPDYCEDDYVLASDDYQERIGEVLVFHDDVGFTPPAFAPADDGLDFIAGITEDNMFDVAPSIIEVDIDPDVTITLTHGGPGFMLGFGLPPSGYNTWDEAIQAAVQARADSVVDYLSQTVTQIRFKLKSMSATFETPIDLTVTELKMPTMIDLEATSGG